MNNILNNGLHTPKSFTPAVQHTDTSGRKDDTGKIRYDLLEPEFERDVANILTIGAEKYGPNNWQGLDNAEDRYYAALRRHIAAWRMGEKIDPESNQSHLAHAACNLMFLMHFDREAK